MGEIKLDTLCECGRPFIDHDPIGRCPEVGCSHFKAVEKEKPPMFNVGRRDDKEEVKDDNPWPLLRELSKMVEKESLAEALTKHSVTDLEAELERRKKKAVEEGMVKSRTRPWKNLDLNGFSTAALEREIIARGDATEKCHSPFPWSPASHHGVNDAEGKSVCICSGSLDAELNDRNTANARILSCAGDGVELARLVLVDWRRIHKMAEDLLKKAGL